eukprot:13329-Heterococcus_DN1.PRE.1
MAVVVVESDNARTCKCARSVECYIYAVQCCSIHNSLLCVHQIHTVSDKSMKVVKRKLKYIKLKLPAE